MTAVADPPDDRLVLGGDASLGAVRVGMLQAALSEHDLVAGTSVGSLNGAVLARDLTPGERQATVAVWR